MPHEQVISFWRKVKTDDALQNALVSLDAHTEDRRPGEIARLGRERGFSFTDRELLEIEAVFAFWQKLRGDAKLQAAVGPINGLSADDAAAALIRLANDSGFRFSNQALNAATRTMVNDGELSEAELSTVAGGGGVGSVGTSYKLAMQGGFDSNKITPGIKAFYV